MPYIQPSLDANTHQLIEIYHSFQTQDTRLSQQTVKRAAVAMYANSLNLPFIKNIEVATNKEGSPYSFDWKWAIDLLLPFIKMGLEQLLSFLLAALEQWLDNAVQLEQSKTMQKDT